MDMLQHGPNALQLWHIADDAKPSRKVAAKSKKENKGENAATAQRQERAQHTNTPLATNCMNILHRQGIVWYVDHTSYGGGLTIWVQGLRDRF